MNILRTQVCIVGSGAGGSTVFDQLASSGVEVIMLEQGRHFTPDDLPQDVATRTALTYRNGGLQVVFGNSPFPLGEGCLLGGSTEVNGGLFWSPPQAVLDDWRRTGFHPKFSDSELGAIVDRLVRDLEVGHFPRHDSDRDTDSELMRQGFEMTGSSTTRALRLVPNCQRANLCPSVCPVGAKNSMSRTLIPRGLSNGGTVITECEVHEISTLKQQSHLVVSTTPRGLLGIECQAVVFAAGTLRTPGLLGTHTKKRVFPLGLHLNVKVIAKFSEPVQAEHSTIFTLQAQDWLHEGIVIMPANLRPEYLAMGIGSASNIEALKLLRDIDSLGLYTVQIRPVHSGRLVRIRGKTTVPWWWITNSDTELATQGIKHLADALFSVGAVSLRLPLRGLPEVTSLAQCTEITRTAKSGDWLFTSVHAMSSTPMGEHSQFCDSNGAVIGHPGLWIGDASALPSTVGESPQGAIMLHAAAMSRSVLERL